MCMECLFNNGIYVSEHEFYWALPVLNFYYFVFLLQNLQWTQLLLQMNISRLQSKKSVEIHSIIALQWVISKLQMALQLQSLLGHLPDDVLQFLSIVEGGLISLVNILPHN